VGGFEHKFRGRRSWRFWGRVIGGETTAEWIMTVPADTGGGCKLVRSMAFLGYHIYHRRKDAIKAIKLVSDAGF
jgi:hypothetical protein